LKNVLKWITCVKMAAAPIPLAVSCAHVTTDTKSMKPTLCVLVRRLTEIPV
jgi:hypothetical protein